MVKITHEAVDTYLLTKFPDGIRRFITITMTFQGSFLRSWQSLSWLRNLWNPTVHCGVSESQSLYTIMSQTNPVHTLWPYFFKTHLNIIFPSTITYPKWSLPFRLSNKNVSMHFSYPRCCYKFSPVLFSMIWSPLPVLLTLSKPGVGKLSLLRASLAVHIFVKGQRKKLIMSWTEAKLSFFVIFQTVWISSHY
jgi:hypothetical protein